MIFDNAVTIAVDTPPASTRSAGAGIPGTRIVKTTPGTGCTEGPAISVLVDESEVGFNPAPRPIANARTASITNVTDKPSGVCKHPKKVTGECFFFFFLSSSSTSLPASSSVVTESSIFVSEEEEEVESS